MRKRKTDSEASLAGLCRKAKELGAAAAAILKTADITVDERAALKCQVPLCAHYGVDLMCPPNVIPAAQFKEVLKCYQNAVLVKVDIPPHDWSIIPVAEQQKMTREAKKKLHGIVAQLESFCLKEGQYFAAGLVGGSCCLCKKCVGVKSGLPCRHPFQARPAMEAVGIAVLATAEKVGWDLGFGENTGRSWVGLVLVS
ncbi:MAG: DUF2284 domain-containing protein [Chloroflexota bacterium]